MNYSVGKPADHGHICLGLPKPMCCHSTDRVSRFPTDLNDRTMAAPHSTVGDEVEFLKLLLALRLMLNYFVREMR